MLITEKLSIPGDHALLLSGQVGQLEAQLMVPVDPQHNHVAILGHPHSLQGGTMNNKVVTTLARAFKELGIASLRFNFRGVGASQGTYDEGIGESEDMLLLARLCQEHLPDTELIFAGFSFGSYVAYRAAAQVSHALLITVAPPVHHYDYKEFSKDPTPWVVIQGEADEVVPFPVVLDFVERFSPPLPLLRFPETGHFFHGKLIDLKSQLMDVIRQYVELA